MRMALVLFALVLTACASKPPAPVVDRSSQPKSGQARAGYYRVNTGDTLYAIAFSHGLDYRALAQWNGLRRPYTIYPGQDLRLSAPPARQSARTAENPSTPSPPARSAAQDSGKTVASRPAKPDSGTAVPAPQPKPTVAAKPSEPKREVSRERPTATGNAFNGAWSWPATGRIIRGFSPTDPSRDGIDIAGKEGDPVRASAAGTVVYSGNGLIGYGELVIVKHDDRWLSAYGHNRKRLVAEGDAVTAGQVIAEMGRNDRNEQVVHFEIRSNGRPVNPLDHLPGR